MYTYTNNNNFLFIHVSALPLTGFQLYFESTSVTSNKLKKMFFVMCLISSCLGYIHRCRSAVLTAVWVFLIRSGDVHVDSHRTD